MLQGLELAVYRFVMRAVDALYLPEFKGSVVRGGFGTTFKRLACVFTGAPAGAPEKSCRECPVARDCPYKAVFESSPTEGAERLGNLQDIPRPFVLRIPNDPRTEYMPGDHLEWEVVLAGHTRKYLPHFVVTFKALGEGGFGLWHRGRRAKAELESVLSVDPFTGGTIPVYEGRENLFRNTDHLVVTGEGIEKTASGMRQDVVILDFLSITRLKYRDSFVEVPEFHVLVRNLLRRVSTLSYFYQQKPVDVDFTGLISRSQAVASEAISIHWVDWERYSGRIKKTMDFGGFAGRIRYSGELAEYLPLLLYGSVVNVGKGGTFGLGQYVVER